MNLPFKAELNAFDTREAWLKAAEAIMAQWIELEGYTYPLNTRVSCGFPKMSKGRGDAIGQCWSTVVSGDEHFEIFISPVHATAADAAETLLHEMVHATVGIENGHNKVFGKLARALGFEGKLTSGPLDADGKELIATRVCDVLGPYPYAPMTVRGGQTTEPVKGKTYLKKCVCSECGYIAYTTAKWINDVGAPCCPEHEAMEVQ